MLKATIRKLKDIRGRRIRSYEAQIGSISASSATDAKHAEALCEKEVLDALERLNRGAIIGQWRGHTWVVSPDTGGWRYWVDVFSRTDYYVGTHGPREDAQDGALSHLASNLWTYDVEDDTAFVEGLPYAVRRELLDRFHWYREMKRLTDKGYTDYDARQILGGFKKEEATA